MRTKRASSFVCILLGGEALWESDATEAAPTEAVEHFVPLASRDMNLESKERNRLMPQMLGAMAGHFM